MWGPNSELLTDRVSDLGSDQIAQRRVTEGDRLDIKGTTAPNHGQLDTGHRATRIQGEKSIDRLKSLGVNHPNGRRYSLYGIPQDAQ